MKGLMAKLKGMPIKRILITHGEKFVLGTVGLIVLLALASTTWGGFDKQPDELLTKATAAGQALHTGAWPEERQAAFKPSTYQDKAQSMYEELNVVDAMSPFAYDKPMSFPIYPREKPREEPEWPSVEHLISDASHMVLGVPPPMPTLEEMEAQAAEAQAGMAGAAANSKKRSKRGDPDESMMVAPDMLAGGMGAGMGMGTSTGLQPRGQRYVALRGIVNLFDIGRAIQKALNLETPADGMALVEVIDFKIQRQKAVAGPNPWPEDTWLDVSLDRADEVLAECGQAADLIATECINPVFTMPLPTRLDGDYSTLVSHPSLERFELSKEQREMEQKLNAAFLDEATLLNLEEQTGKRRGFQQSQYDINGIRNQVMGMGGANVGEVYKKAGFNPAGAGAGMPGMGAGRPGMPGMMGGAGRPGGGAMLPEAMGRPMGRPGMGGAGAGMPGMGMPGMGMPGMGMPGMAGGMNGMAAPVGAAAAGYLMLFRYLDFDVNPGECYRYRVKLEFANPNYGMSLDKVKEQSVLEGETRMTDWSAPSAPVVVKPDTSLFLADIDKRNRTRGEARIRVYQWDPSLGTYVDSKIPTKFGQFIGGLASSMRLDLGTPAYEEKQVLFATKDFLLDTALPPAIIPGDNPDLNLTVDAKQAKEGVDLPNEALIMDEYGQLKVLDSVSDKPTEVEVEKMVQAEREPWKYLESTGEEKNNLGALDGAAGAGMMPEMMPGMGGPRSALKRNKKGPKGRAGASPLAPDPSAAGGRANRNR